MVNLFLSPSTGIINKIIQLFGGDPVAFMQEPQYFLPIYVISAIWQSTEWSSIIYIAALAGVSPELHEVAIVDGASKWKHDGRVILAEYGKIRHLICNQTLEIIQHGENAEVFLRGGNRYHFYSQAQG